MWPPPVSYTVEGKARLLAVFVVNTDDKELVLPPSEDLLHPHRLDHRA